jgi:hypothetical protein
MASRSQRGLVGCCWAARPSACWPGRCRCWCGDGRRIVDAARRRRFLSGSGRCCSAQWRSEIRRSRATRVVPAEGRRRQVDDHLQPRRDQLPGARTRGRSGPAGNSTRYLLRAPADDIEAGAADFFEQTLVQRSANPTTHRRDAIEACTCCLQPALESCTASSSRYKIWLATLAALDGDYDAIWIDTPRH